MYRDYGDKVNFYYIYKRLAHPETNNFQEPANLKERLLHVAEAKRLTQTEIPWLCDTMDDAATKAFGEAYNGEFVLDPEGKVVRQRYWSNPKTLRHDLANLIGPVKKPTRIKDLDTRFRPEPRCVASGVVPPIELPQGLSPVKVKYVPKGNKPLFVKLRAERTTSPVNGRYQLYLGFYVDPIHKTHWNNAAGPVRMQIQGCASLDLPRCNQSGPKVDVPADVDPRMFLVDFESLGDAPIRVKFHYVVCDDAETFCCPVTQYFELSTDLLQNGSTRPAIFLDQVFARMSKYDRNHDGKISRGELKRGYATLYLSHIDYNLNNVIDEEELERFNLMYNNGRGIGKY